jgi:hypothetical protein
VTDERKQEGVTARLSRLRDATSALAVPAGLEERLAKAALAPRPPARAGVVLPFARIALVAAALAAAASIGLALNIDRNVDDLLLDSVSDGDDL